MLTLAEPNNLFAGAFDSPPDDRWHELLTSRYVCEACLTRFFTPRHRCPACHRFGYMHPLDSTLLTIARSEQELRHDFSWTNFRSNRADAGQ